MYVLANPSQHVLGVIDLAAWVALALCAVAFALLLAYTRTTNRVPVTYTPSLPVVEAAARIAHAHAEARRLGIATCATTGDTRSCKACL